MTASRAAAVVDQLDRTARSVVYSRANARHAQVAQLVEHATENRSVGGSIPPLGTIPNQRLRRALRFSRSLAWTWLGIAVGNARSAEPASTGAISHRRDCWRGALRVSPTGVAQPGPQYAR